MMSSGHDADDRSFPELLAAYADGELDADGRARVDAWLANHPEARAALETQIRLSRRNRKLWKATAPLAPSEGSWARVLGRVQDLLDSPPRPALPRPRRIRAGYVAVAVATAAALVLAVYLQPPTGERGGDRPPIHDAVEPLALARDADVDILSLDDRDSTALVIGRDQLLGAVVLASVGEVDLKGVQKDPNDGMMPKVQMTDAGNAPMIIAPLAGR